MSMLNRHRFAGSRLAMAIVAMALAARAMGAEVPPITPLSVYGNLPSMELLALSPDGTRIASIQTVDEHRDLWILRLDGGNPIHAGRVGEAKVRSLLWGDNDNLFIEVSSTSLPPVGFIGAKHEWWMLEQYRLSRDTLAPVSFQVLGERVFNVLSDEPYVRTINGAATLFLPGAYVAGDVLLGLFRYDISSGSMRLIEKSHAHGIGTDWLVNDSGKIAAQLDYNGQSQEWHLKLPRNDLMVPVLSGTAAIDVPSMAGFGPDGDSLIMTFIENGEVVRKSVKLSDGSVGPSMGNYPPFEHLLVDRKTSRVVGGRSLEPESRYVFFDNEMQAKWNAVLRAFPGDVLNLVSTSDDYSRILVTVAGPTDGYEYALFDWYTHKSVVIGKVYEGLGAVFEQKRIDYPAADGLGIPGYLTLPHSAAADAAHGPLPLVVLPHGGPQVADHAGFDWWAQALAAQGYAVLQPNYRGSALGKRFVAAGYGEWGRKMQTDLSDGVRFLVKEGVADPQRVCIVGGSYGGYAALAGITLDNGVYRCAVSVAGLSDLHLFLRTKNTEANTPNNLTQRYWDRFMGVTSAGDPSLTAISPIAHVSAITAPLLLIHGRDDTVVPYAQSIAMRDAMKQAGKSVEMVTLDREDHWLSRTETRLKMLEATVAFLETNNPPD